MRDANDNFARRRAVRETVILGMVFLIALFLFFTTVHFIATREAAYELKDRPRGLILGWLTAIAIGLILGRTRQDADAVLPKSLMIIRGPLQAMLLLLFSGVLCYNRLLPLHSAGVGTATSLEFTGLLVRYLGVHRWTGEDPAVP